MRASGDARPVNFLAGRPESCQMPRIFRASSRISSLSILNLSVLSGMPSDRAVAVTFQADFSSARTMKLRSNVGHGPIEQVLGGRSCRRIELGDMQLVRQVLVGNPLFVRYGDQPLDQVLELSNVAGPPVGAEDLQRRVGNALEVLPELQVVAAQEELRERREVLDPVAQRRHADGDDLQPVIQVFAEAPLLDRLIEVDVRGGNQPEGGLDRVGSADTFDLILLNRAQQLGLQVVTEVADLVEEQGAAVGQLELAQLLPHGAGEGPLLVAEEGALDELARNRGEVDCDERRVRLTRFAMNKARQQLLAGAAFAENQHGGVQLCHLLHELENLSCRAAGAGDELPVVLLLRNLGAQTQHIPAQILAFAGVGNERTHAVEVEVFRDVVIRPVSHRLDGDVELFDHRDDDDLDVRIVLADDLQHLESADAGQADVEEHQVDVFLFEDLQGELARRGAEHTVVAPQHRGERLPHSLIVVNDEDRLAPV